MVSEAMSAAGEPEARFSWRSIINITRHENHEADNLENIEGEACMEVFMEVEREGGVGRGESSGRRSREQERSRRTCWRCECRCAWAPAAGRAETSADEEPRGRGVSGVCYRGGVTC